MPLRDIVVQGAREHNLKGIDLRIPRGALTTITGVSGSGKSSLAFDTIFQEGQRRFLESLSAYARQFLGTIEKPKVDHVEGLSPTISIDQKTVNRNPRSTVGTITELYDHLRLLFARLGTPHCTGCGRLLSAQTRDQIAARLLERAEGLRVEVLAPIVRGRKGEYRRELDELRQKGFVRARIDGEMKRLDEPIQLAKYVKHVIEVVVDRLVATPERRDRLAEAVNTALAMAENNVAALIDDTELLTFSSSLNCPECGLDFPALEPRLFSFNSAYGACPTCTGLGVDRRFDPELLVADAKLSIKDGALKVMNKSGYLSYSRLGPQSLEKVARTFGFRVDQPWGSLTKEQQDVILWGSGDQKIRLRWEYQDPSSKRVVKGEDFKPLEGVIPAMEKFYRVTKAAHLERFMSEQVCRDCDGTRLRKEARAVTFREQTIVDLASLTVEDLAAWFDTTTLVGNEAAIGKELWKEARTRLKFLLDVGLGYLPLARGASTLSGGEAQRVRLATQVGAHLQGVLYVLDEPSIGLHQRDNHRLLGTLEQLRDRGNTVIVVEHDRDTMLASDHLVDIGPGAGRHGGEIVAEGLPSEVFRSKKSLTAQYLRGDREIAMPAVPRTGNGHALVIRGARQHNLKNVDVTLPLGCLVAVTGVSGSGKSTLVDLVLKRALARRLHGAQDPIGAHDSIEGIEHIDKVIEIDQSPIGRTPRSNPATYSGAWTHVRDLFTALPEARARGYKAGRFSFNVSGGRCEECGGAGVRLVEMQLLADVEVPCDACDGRRYNRETLEIKYREKNVSQVLDLTVDEALVFFAAHPKLSRVLETMQKVGLGYVQLGQTATTLSGGEAQRLKLASELARPGTGRTLYLLDEPTTGLHFVDIAQLLGALQELVDRGNSVIVVEHNLDVVKCADWLIDLGPEGGKAGGEIVFAGTPRESLRAKSSWTGRMLAEYLEPAKPKADVVRRDTGEGEGAALKVFGATKNNLRGVDAVVPHSSFTVITGVSGSGKTSLAFDTIFAEAQRRFVESMSTYARRFLSRQERAPVERVEGLAPAIAIDRKSGAKNPRSTVATSTEMHDYLRVLFARVGIPHCPECGAELAATGPSAAARDVVAKDAGKKLRVVAPLWRKALAVPLALKKPQELTQLWPELKKQGFARVEIDGIEARLDAPAPKVAAGTASIDLVVDRIVVKADARQRLADAFDQAMAAGSGLAIARAEDGAERVYTKTRICPTHGVGLDEDPQPRLFSFNFHLGACPQCDGLGVMDRCDVARLVADPSLPLLAGALTQPWNVDLAKPHFGIVSVLGVLAERLEFDLDTPFGELPGPAKKAILHGFDESLSLTVVRDWASGRRESTYELTWPGLVGYFERKYRESDDTGFWHSRLAPLMSEGPCRGCGGARLNPLARAFTLGGRSLPAILALSVDDALAFFRKIELPARDAEVANEVTREVTNRLEVLHDVGLGYLTLDRRASTLSGGEAQRIRLATQLGNRLVGVLYVLDEPTIGLHPRDTARLIATLKGLQKLGNTIVVVEHDPDVIRAADWVIDVGPGAGERGGRVIAEGPLASILASPDSITGAWLRGDRKNPAPEQKRPVDGPRIELTGARLHNLKDVDVAIPLATLTVVTGVSGSGKSTLVMDVLEPALRNRLALGRRRTDGTLKSLSVPERLNQLVVVDQAPLGPTPASNPATYTGIFDDVRDVFASTPDARMKGFTRRHFSFNHAGGRCEACEGKGLVQVEMHFLSDVFVQCEACGGKRFDVETLKVRWNGKNIAEVLDLEVDRALELFGQHRRIARILKLLSDVGLGYMRLGQPATTLSGGEAQRVRLAAELARPEQGSTLYLLDEPTTGLHLEDVARLLQVLDRLVAAGNTVLVIEHNEEVIRAADWVIDLGPEGGAEGGRIVATGRPEEIARVAASITGQRLKDKFFPAPRGRRLERTA